MKNRITSRLSILATAVIMILSVSAVNQISFVI